jgi:hypothetical protein
MTVDQFEMAILQALLALFVTALTAGIAYLTRQAKAYLAVHASGKAAEVATTVLDGLSQIATAVVQDYNQRVVSDAKASGVWNAKFAEALKREAVQAVMDQGAALVSLAKDNVGNVEALVAALVEKAVTDCKTAKST